MLKILVERKGFYSDLRENDIGFRDCYDVSASFKPTEENGEELGNIDDLVEMFISAAKLEGYATNSIIQSLYDHAIYHAFEEQYMIKAEEDDHLTILN